MNGATRILTVCAILCMSVRAASTETPGSSGRSLAPGTFDKTDTTNEPRNRNPSNTYRPPAAVEMGNRPISQTSRSNFGLSAATRRKLDEALGDPSKIDSVLDQLPLSERAAAEDYLQDQLQPTGQGSGLIPPKSPKKTASASECLSILARLRPHAPSQAWLVDQMERSHCKPDGKPMSMREAIKYEMKMDDRRSEASRANGDGVFDCSYKPAGGGAAWDATCAPQGRWPAGATCNAGEICPDEAKRYSRTTPASGNGTAGTVTNPGRDLTAPSRPLTGGSNKPAPSKATPKAAAGTAHGRNPVTPQVTRQRNTKSDLTGVGAGARVPGAATAATTRTNPPPGGIRIDKSPVGRAGDLSDVREKFRDMLENPVPQN
jgi:hypothetical protein